jgi:hypothetical protein
MVNSTGVELPFETERHCKVWDSSSQPSANLGEGPAPACGAVLKTVEPKG